MSQQVGLYLPKSARQMFSENVFKLDQHALHRFHMPFANNVRAWHVTNHVTNYFPWSSRGKIVLTIHDLNFLYEKESASKKNAYLCALQKKATKADVVIAISKFVKAEIAAHLKDVAQKTQVIYNGCNIPDEVILSAPANAPDFPFVFALGAISAKKNFHILPAAITNNELHLVIAGIVQDKQYFEKIFAAAKKSGVEKRVHYLGAISEPEKFWLLKNCSLFSFPSIAEGFGLPVIEAMRFGKPVMLSKATSLPEIGGSAAFYLNSFDESEVSNVANYALSNFDENTAKETIKWSLQFDWNKSAEEYWKVYETLVN